MSSVIDIKQADPTRPNHKTRYLLVASGRDGVGKSSICTNLAIVLAREGKRVCILDADSGITNTHRLLGICPKYSLAQVVNGDCILRDAVSNGPGDIMMVLDGDHTDAFKLQDKLQQQQFLQQLQSWEYELDYVLIDTSATNTSALSHFIDVADELLLVLAPQPNTLSETFSLLSHQDQARRGKPKHIVINRVSGATQAETVFNKFSTTVKKYLDSNVLYCGYIGADDNIRNGFALQHPVALYQEEDPSCAYFLKLAQSLETQLAPHIAHRAALSEELARYLNTDTLVTETPGSRSVAGDTLPPPADDKTFFMNMPVMADELIHAGALNGDELKSVVDKLVATGRHEFRHEFNHPAVPSTTSVPATGEPDIQQSLLSALQRNRSTGKSLDQLLNEFLGEKH